MNSNINDIDDRIGKYLAGEATQEEKAWVESWLQEPGNRKYFDQVRFIFDRAATVKEVHAFDTDVAWQRMKAKLAQKETKVVPMRPSNTNLFLRIAASLLLVSLVAYFAYFVNQSGVVNVQEIASDRTTQTDTLPDGTNVFLNKQTKLAYRFDKKEKQHRVTLQGEAYFNIHHEEDKAFIIDVDETFIRDIGTSFNVKAYPGEPIIEVVVDEGEVIFYTAQDSGVHLQAGGKGVYNKITKKFSVEEAQPNVTAYKTKLFVFNDQDLGSVVSALNSVYEGKINVSESLKNCRVTVSFNQETIEEIAAVLSETLGAAVSQQGDQFYLEGVSCE